MNNFSEVMKGTMCCRCEEYFPETEGCNISVYKNYEGIFGLVGGYYSCIDLSEYRFVDDVYSLEQLCERFPYFEGYLKENPKSNLYEGADICDICFEKMLWYNEIRFWNNEEEEMSTPDFYPYVTQCCEKLIETRDSQVYKLWTQMCYPYDKCYILSDMNIRETRSNDYNAMYSRYKYNYVWYMKNKKKWMKERAIVCKECVSWNEAVLSSYICSVHNCDINIASEYDTDKSKFRYFLKDLIWKQFHVRQLRILSLICIKLPKDIQKLILSYIVKLVEYPESIKLRTRYIKSKMCKKSIKIVENEESVLMDSNGIIYNSELCVRYIQPLFCKTCKKYAEDGIAICPNQHYRTIDNLVLYHADLYESKCKKDGVLFSFDKDFERKINA